MIRKDEDGCLVVQTHFSIPDIRAAILAVLDDGQKIIRTGKHTSDVTWYFPRDESDESTARRMDFCDAVVKELTK